MGVVKYLLGIKFRMHHFSSFESKYIISHISFLITGCTENLRYIISFTKNEYDIEVRLSAVTGAFYATYQCCYLSVQVSLQVISVFKL